ncbi:hypothetical protein ScPMuIL_001607 [Solemya velum]
MVQVAFDVSLILLLIYLSLGACSSRRYKKNIQSVEIGEEPDYDSIEYGGVLRETIPEAVLSDTDVLQAVKHAHLFIRNRFPWSLPERKEMTSVHNLRKVRLGYTEDDWTIAEIDFSVLLDGQHYRVTGPLDFGMTYSFDLQWQKNNFNILHSILLTTFPDADSFNVFHHTFHITNVNSTKKTCDSSPKFWQNSFENICARQDSESIPFSYCYTHHVNQHILQDADHQLLYDNSLSSHLSCGQGLRQSDKLIGYQNPIKTGFTVMTYNTWNMDTMSGKSADYIKRIKHFGEIVASSGVDVVAFQEVRYEFPKGGELGPNQAQHLADLLPGYQYIFQPGQLHPNSVYDGRTEEGVAIYSRFPIIEHDYILLFRNRSNSADLHQRVCLHVGIDVPYIGRIHVFVTHLSLSHEAREQSVVQIWKYMKKFKGPAVLLGDLNAEPDERAVRFLRGEIALSDERVEHLTDAWLYFHPKDQGLTYNSLHKKLSKRIDYIFVRKDSLVRLEDVSVVDDEKRGTAAASDHLPVKATLVLNIPTH